MFKNTEIMKTNCSDSEHSLLLVSCGCSEYFDVFEKKCLQDMYGGSALGPHYQDWCLVVDGRRCYRTFRSLSFDILPSETISRSYDHKEGALYHKLYLCHILCYIAYVS